MNKCGTNRLPRHFKQRMERDGSLHREGVNVNNVWNEVARRRGACREGSSVCQGQGASAPS